MTSDDGTAPNPPNTETASAKGFNWFKGVYTPSLLTILGVIMYMRMGWVLGNVGLAKTLLIVTLATSITFLTGLSISAIATNMKVGAGGAYFMISRSLGVEPGAAIGIPLYLAQTLVIAFYITGFSEAFVGAFPELAETVPFFDIRSVGIATAVLLAAVALISADLALKTQFFILGMILLSLASLFAGGSTDWGEVVSEPDPGLLPFWTVFAVFFPAVTGIEAGIALSGNLKRPARALPWGTLGAVVTGYAVYMTIPIFLASIVPPEVLRTDFMVMRRIAYWGDAILLGVWGATLSSALSSLLGAPRTLQALARDGVLPRFLGRGTGSGDEPRIATAFTFLIALTGILLGDLNSIGPILSMFFLTSYGMLNLSAGFEAIIGSPAWRPTFRPPWFLAFLGALGCLFVMLLINAGATLIAVAFCLIVYFLMERRELKAHWGDVRYGILMLMARFAVYRMALTKPDARTWRPNILVLSGSPASRWHLIELANAMTHGSGFLTVATIIPRESSGSERVKSIKSAVREFLNKRGVSALVEIHFNDDTMAGVRSLVKSYGIGPLVPNTFLLGKSDREEGALDFAELLELAHRTRRNVVIVREGQSEPKLRRERRIDVWWGRQLQNAGLMLALAYLLKTDADWGAARLHLRTVVDDPEESRSARQQLEALVLKGRLEAEVDVVVRQASQSRFDLIREQSRDAHLVFLGIRPPEEAETIEDYGSYFADLVSRTDDLPPTALVLATEDIDFRRIFS